MSELENKASDGPEGGAHHGTNNGPKDDKGLGLGVIFFMGAFLVCFLSGWLLFPKLLYSKKEQPFNFDHNLHAEETGDCETCHFFREDGTFSGIPGLQACMECHTDEPMGETDDEAVFVEEYVAKGKEVPWLIYAKQPDCVFFSMQLIQLQAAWTVRPAMVTLVSPHLRGPMKKTESPATAVTSGARTSGGSKRIPGIV